MGDSCGYEWWRGIPQGDILGADRRPHGRVVCASSPPVSYTHLVVPFIERLLGTQFMSKEVYYISNLPSELQWKDVTTITGVSFVLSLVATIYPSWRASRVNPAEALRYE